MILKSSSRKGLALSFWNISRRLKPRRRGCLGGAWAAASGASARRIRKARRSMGRLLGRRGLGRGLVLRSLGLLLAVLRGARGADDLLAVAALRRLDAAVDHRARARLGEDLGEQRRGLLAADDVHARDAVLERLDRRHRLGHHA